MGLPGRPDDGSSTGRRLPELGVDGREAHAAQPLEVARARPVVALHELHVTPAVSSNEGEYLDVEVGEGEEEDGDEEERHPHGDHAQRPHHPEHEHQEDVGWSSALRSPHESSWAHLTLEG